MKPLANDASVRWSIWMPSSDVVMVLPSTVTERRCVPSSSCAEVMLVIGLLSSRV